MREARAFDNSAVIPAGKHLFPFRTEKLSLPGPMVLGGQPPGRVGRRRLTSQSPRLRRALLVLRETRAFPAGRPGQARCARVSPAGGGRRVAASTAPRRRGEAAPTSLRGSEFFSPPVRVERAQALHALADRRVRREQGGEADLCERVDRVERLGRRARGELEQLLRLLEAEERVGQAVRGAAQAGGDAVGGELALRAQRGGAGTRPRSGRGRTAAPARASRRSGSSRRPSPRARRAASARSRRGCGSSRARARGRPRAPPASARRRARARRRSRRRACRGRPTARAGRCPAGRRGVASARPRAPGGARPSSAARAPLPNGSSRAPIIPSTTRSA